MGTIDFSIPILIAASVYAIATITKLALKCFNRQKRIKRSHSKKKGNKSTTLKLKVLTFNVNQLSPKKSIAIKSEIDRLMTDSDILAIGLQEVEMSLLTILNFRCCCRLSNNYVNWISSIKQSGETNNFAVTYKRSGSTLQITCFHRETLPDLRYEYNDVSLGCLRVLGNKAASGILIKFENYFDDLVLVNMHLDADIRGQNRHNKRVESFKHVIDEMKFTLNRNLPLIRTENLILFGDLNFRIRNDEDELEKLLESTKVFEFFSEIKPNKTTYPIVYDKENKLGRDEAKASFTDRVLLKNNSKLKAIETKILEDVTGSDHLPVMCSIEMSKKSA